MYRERNVLEFFATQNRGTKFGRNAGARLDEIRNDESWRIEYMTYEMALMDARYDGRSEGIAIGIAEGTRENALATAQKLKARDMPLEDIADITGLSLDEVKAL